MITASVTKPRTRLERFRDAIRSFRAKNTAVSTVGPISMPTSRAMQDIKTYFSSSYNKYERLEALEILDSELQSGLSTASIIVDKSMMGYKLKVGEEITPKEKELQDELDLFYANVVKPLNYDIAYKLFRDGDAVFVEDRVKNLGIRDLVWLPMSRLTVLEDKRDATQLNKIIQEANWYVLNEVPTTMGTMPGDTKMQYFKGENVAHFNWGRKERVIDLWNRETYGIFTRSPTMSLVPKVEGKLSAFLNDALIKDVMVPREHHKLPSEAFNPDFFQGDNQEAKILAAQAAAEAVLTVYAKGLEGRRVDRGYVTLDNVLIEIIEPRMAYNAPNEYIKQIDNSINRSMGTPESVLSGQTSVRGSFASEIAVGAYLIVKAEFLAERIVEGYKKLGRNHIKIKFGTQMDEYLDNIDFKLQLIFFQSEMARMIAILASVGIWTYDELRDKMGDPPLREDQKENLVVIQRGFMQSANQQSASQQQAEQPVQEQKTEQSKSDTQTT